MKKLKELYDYREMIFSLVRRDIKGRYKGSVLGFLWTFLNPLLQLCVYTFVFGIVLKNNIENFYLYLFVALVPWVFFASSLIGGSMSVVSQKNMVTKIYFPREVLPISFVTTSFVNMLYTFVIVLAAVFISGVKPSLLALLTLPIIMLVEYLLALGIAMIVSALTVFFRDLEHILSVIVMAWQFLTPIFYSIEIVPNELKTLFMANPMTSIIIAYRDILYYGRVPQFSTLILAFVMGITFLLLGFYIFGILQRRFAEEL